MRGHGSERLGKLIFNMNNQCIGMQEGVLVRNVLSDVFCTQESKSQIGRNYDTVVNCIR